MVLRSASNQRRARHTHPSSGTPEESAERIRQLHAESCHDAVRDEARTLAQRLGLTQQRVQELSVCQEALREEVRAVMAHEHYAVVITGVDRRQPGGRGRRAGEPSCPCCRSPGCQSRRTRGRGNGAGNTRAQLLAQGDRCPRPLERGGYVREVPRVASPHSAPRPRDAGGHRLGTTPPRHTLKER